MDKILYCSNEDACPYGQVAENDGKICIIPAHSYSQKGSLVYLGLCLNCLDDHRRDMENRPGLE